MGSKDGLKILWDLKNLMGIGFQMGQILWDFISECEIWHVCQYWGTDTELMISSGTNESSTMTVIPTQWFEYKRNYTKFSASAAPFCIKLLQCCSTPKVWKQRVWWAVSASNMHTPPSTQQLMQSERHHSRLDACPSNMPVLVFENLQI